MKSFAVLIVAFLCCAASAVAQVVTLEVQLESGQYLANEPLVAKIRISNATGQTLRLGDDPDWLSFTIESTEGPYVKSLRAPDVIGGFELESSHTATKRIDLAPCFDLTRVGRYKIVANVHVPRFAKTYRSPEKSFYIASGSELWKKTFGVPNAGPAEGEPEIRNYVLVQAISGNDNRLYARVTDRSEQNVRVVPLGKLVSFSKPEAQLDKWSNLHVLYQTGARSFSYSAINPEGLLLSRETHLYTETRPALATDDEGRIAIRGGVRRRTQVDIPPVEISEITPPDVEPDLVQLPVAVDPTPPKKGKKPAPKKDAKEQKK